MTLDCLLGRKAAKRAVAAQQDPGLGISQGKRKTIGQGKTAGASPVRQGAHYTGAVQIFNGEAETY